jgi:cobalt/nickel transport system permease protein
MSAGVLIGAKISYKSYLKLLVLPTFFLMTSVLAILLSISTTDVDVLNPIWQFEIGTWKLYMSTYNVNQAQQVVFTVLASISCMYFFMLTTPIHQLIWLLQKVRIPQLFIELVVFTYRFIFVLMDNMQEIYVAQSSRLAYQKRSGWLTSVSQLIVGLFIKSIRSAKELQIALDSRGGEEGMYEVELDQTYNRYHWLGMAFLMIFLLTIYMVT